MAKTKELERTDKWNQAFDAILSDLNIQPDDWDLVLIGDGSGSMWNYCIGWACVAVIKGEMGRKLFYGGANDGTVNIAEPLAYLIPLCWYASEIDRRGERLPKKVHIITDSQYTSNKGNSGTTVTEGAHTALWSALEMLNRRGFFLTWHWIDRETYALNTLVDSASKHGRHCVQDVPLAIQPSDFNPD